MPGIPSTCTVEIKLSTQTNMQNSDTTCPGRVEQENVSIYVRYSSSMGTYLKYGGIHPTCGLDNIHAEKLYVIPEYTLAEFLCTFSKA